MNASQQKLDDDKINVQLQRLLNISARFSKIFLFVQFALIAMVCFVKLMIIYQLLAAEKIHSNDNPQNINCPAFFIFNPSIYDDIFLNIKSSTFKKEQFYFKHVLFYIVFWTMEIFYVILEFIRQSKFIFMIESVHNCIDPRILRHVSFQELRLVLRDSLCKLKGIELDFDGEKNMREYFLQNIYNNTKLIGWIQMRCMHQDVHVFTNVLNNCIKVAYSNSCQDVADDGYPIFIPNCICRIIKQYIGHSDLTKRDILKLF